MTDLVGPAGSVRGSPKSRHFFRELPTGRAYKRDTERPMPASGKVFSATAGATTARTIPSVPRSRPMRRREAIPARRSSRKTSERAIAVR
jgi:hypothetical protein